MHEFYLQTTRTLNCFHLAEQYQEFRFSHCVLGVDSSLFLFIKQPHGMIQKRNLRNEFQKMRIYVVEFHTTNQTFKLKSICNGKQMPKVSLHNHPQAKGNSCYKGHFYSKEHFTISLKSSPDKRIFKKVQKIKI